MVKISKIHQRVQQRSGIMQIPVPVSASNRHKRAEESLLSKLVAVSKRPEKFYYAYMSKEAAQRADHSGAVVITIRSGDAPAPMRYNAVAQYDLVMEPDVSSVDKEVVSQISNLLIEHLPNCRSLHVHCSYGEIRSYSLVEGFVSGIGASDEEAYCITRNGSFMPMRDIGGTINSTVARMGLAIARNYTAARTTQQETVEA